ncbi:hypothetical protein EK21DRAFT_115775 [Setomelanomma holmii]|uniref:Uncharacterized protein n=1 Tax=Setomelanomma holmii TaxID=210430 RepID=A0A9P4H3D8_9PLEO|nr:hypothetical protein EK21DRAFT_115775 [Setomelanomma holmii]
MASTLDKTNATYLALWENSTYTNFAMIRYILEKMYHDSTNPWIDFFVLCDRRMTPNLSNKALWEEASGFVAAKKPQLFGTQRSLWDDKIPTNLCAGGDGLCTSFRSRLTVNRT